VKTQARFGQLVQSRLEEDEYTQEWLETNSGVSQATINRIINGKGNSGLNKIVKIAEVLGIDLNALKDCPECPHRK
jgi:transcriptional regulator with XRE-family HTH domain